MGVEEGLRKIITETINTTTRQITWFQFWNCFASVSNWLKVGSHLLYALDTYFRYITQGREQWSTIYCHHYYSTPCTDCHYLGNQYAVNISIWQNKCTWQTVFATAAYCRVCIPECSCSFASVLYLTCKLLELKKMANQTVASEISS